MLLRPFTLKLFPRGLLVAPNQGFTLIEMLITLIIAGILVAVAVPSMVGLRARGELKDALTQVKGALQDAQRIAIKTGKFCEVSLSSSSVGSKIGSEGCVPNPVNLPSGITLNQTTYTDNTIKFSHKGTIATGDGGTLVLSSNLTSDLKCLVISAPLGILRSGNYEGTIPSASILADDCKTSL